MAAVSFSLSRGALLDTLAAGSQTITEGTAAPGAGDIELRIADPGSVAWTKREIKEAVEAIWRFLQDPTKSTSIPL